MADPITHEKIIEVLQELGAPYYMPANATATPEWQSFYRSALARQMIARDLCQRLEAGDLYQRLQAEKEVGWQPTHWIAAAGAKFERVTQAWCPDIPGEMVVFRNRDGRHFVRPLDTFNSLYTPLNQEGGDAPETAGRDSPNEVGKHVAPPASATAGTGRATPWRYLINYGPDGEENYANVYTDNGELVGNLRIGVAMKIVDGMNALVSEHQRGLAEGERIEREVVAAWMITQGFATGHGDTTSDLLSELADGIADRVSRSERIGIEKAAKVADDHPLSPSPVKTVERIVSAIRALNTKPAPEVDPNAWAFKHGLEST